MSHRTIAVRLALTTALAAGCHPRENHLRPPTPPIQVVQAAAPLAASDSSPALALPVAAPAPVESDPVHRLLDQAVRQYDATDDYIARLRRRETTNGRSKPMEVMAFKFRKKPMSAHFKWIGEEGKGRELVWAEGQHGGKLNIILAAGDIPFSPAGKRMALDPDSYLVKAASKYSIRESGVGHTISRFSDLVKTVDRGELPPGTLKYLGRRKRDDCDGLEMEVVECKLPPGRDEHLPKGGIRHMYFDPVTHFPALVVAHDPDGKEAEYFAFDRFQLNVGLDDADFDPEKLFPPPAKPTDKPAK